MDLLQWFEDKVKSSYPSDARQIINSLLESEESLKVNFKFLNYGNYEILDFRELQKIKDGQTLPIDYDKYSNPFFLIESIEDFITRYLNKKYNLKNILPFARATFADKTWYIFFAENNPNPYALDINWIEAKLIESKKPISKYVELEKIIEFRKTTTNSSLSFDKKKMPYDIIPSTQIFIGDAECVGDVNDYKDVLTNILNLSSNKFIITSFHGNEFNSKRTIDLTINNEIDGKIMVEGDTDWFDSSCVDQLNTLLGSFLTDYKFVEFRDNEWGQEFGIAYANEENILEFANNGYIKTTK